MAPAPAQLGLETEPDLGLYRVMREDGSLDPDRDPHLAPELLLRAYREMRRLRVLDARMVLMQRQGRVGFYGAATGQEAVPIATGLALDPVDWVFPALREQSIMLARGYALKLYLAQVFGNTMDVLKGRQPPSHQAAKAVHQVSWSPCIGSQLPQAVGAAWAMKMRRRGAASGPIAVGFCGDGATSEPDFHTAMNFAGVFQVPVVLVCQNNHWSISVPTERQTASKTIAVKGRAYGVPGVRVDGNDFLALMKVLGDAFRRARAGGGPTFVEAVTYRMGAHTTSDDPSRYRSDAEVEVWRQRDPIDRLRRHLQQLGLMDDERDKLLEKELDQEVVEVVKAVEGLPPPDRASMFDDVYAEVPWHLAEQRAELAKLPSAPTHG